MTKNNIIVIDTETWGLDTNYCECVELAALVLSGETLQPIEGAEFQSYIKPIKWDNFYKRAIEVNKITPELLKEKGRDRRAVFEAFETFCKQYRVGGYNGDPIASGKNIKDFDLPIINRIVTEEKMVGKDGKNKLFHKRIIIDLEDELWTWFRGHTGSMPPSFKMDDLRPYFGMSSEGAHGALVDVKQEALLVQRFLQVRSKFKVNFEGALKGVSL